MALQQAKSVRRLASGVKTSDPLTQGGEAGLDLKYHNTSLIQKVSENSLLGAKSYLEVQSEALQHISGALDRLSQLVVLMEDSTKSASDLDNYLKEFDHVRTEISSTRQRQFNGIDLMYVSGGAGAQTFSVQLDESGTQTMNITQTDFGTETVWEQLLGSTISNPADIGDSASGFYTTVADLVDEVGGFGISGITTLQNDLAKRIAQNAAEQSRLGSALDHLRQRTSDFDQAGSRIFDTDVAEEVTNLARKDILLRGIVASRIQSNVLSDVALRVMGG